MSRRPISDPKRCFGGIGTFLVLSLALTACERNIEEQPYPDGESTDQNIVHEIETRTAIGMTGLLIHGFSFRSGYYLEDGDVLHIIVVGKVTSDSPPEMHEWRTVNIYARCRRESMRVPDLRAGYAAYSGSGVVQSIIPTVERQFHASAALQVERLSNDTISVYGLLQEKARYFDDRFRAANSVVFRDITLDRTDSAAEFESLAGGSWNQIRPVFEDPEGLTYEGAGRWIRQLNGTEIVVEKGVDVSDFFEEIDKTIENRRHDH